MNTALTPTESAVSTMFAVTRLVAGDVPMSIVALFVCSHTTDSTGIACAALAARKNPPQVSKIEIRFSLVIFQNSSGFLPSDFQK
jgi:hypothetical protein